jgi:hypothetical protein
MDMMRELELIDFGFKLRRRGHPEEAERGGRRAAAGSRDRLRLDHSDWTEGGTHVV